MGQIVFNGQKPKYCNLAAITTGTHAADVPAAGEVWLIDTTNSSKTNGSGKYDKYIIGDNSHTASYLATNALMNIDNAQQIEIDSAPTSGSVNAVSSGGVYQAIQSIDVSGQISGKADKSEMSVVAGTGANADKTTITLKNGTSATVLTQHQDISGKQDIIPDITTIRNNASAGATAIQSVTVGTTTTGVAGSSASVTNTGTATEPVLSFTIPRGAQGIQGIQGIQGVQGERGPVGANGVTTDATIAIITGIDTTTQYDSTKDVASAEAVQDVLKMLGRVYYVATI